MAQTELMRLREQIAREHEAACWALSRLAAGTLQHRLLIDGCGASMSTLSGSVVWLVSQ